MHPKSIKNYLKKEVPFRSANVYKITKITEIMKIGPQASKIAPRASKITKNHDSDLPKSRTFHRKLLAFCTLVFKTSWQHVFKKVLQT